MEARTKEGEEYCCSALLGFRNSVERHLNNNRVTVKISKTRYFKTATNSRRQAQNQPPRWQKKMFNISQLLYHLTLPKFEPVRSSCSMTTPAALLRRTWFYISLNWCRRGREGQRDLRRDSFKFTREASGREYTVMTHEEAAKSQSGESNLLE